MKDQSPNNISINTTSLDEQAVVINIHKSINAKQELPKTSF
jgi:hypothetical protein